MFFMEPLTTAFVYGLCFGLGVVVGECLIEKIKKYESYTLRPNAFYYNYSRR
jgi:hypothetical protein